MADDLKKRRKAIKAKLTRFQNFISKINVESVNDEQVNEFKHRFDVAKPLLDQYDEVHNEILTLVTDIEDEILHQEQFETSYFQIFALAKSLLDKINDDSKSSNGSSPQRSVERANSIDCSHKPSMFHLPKITIPQFSGNLDDWLEFREIFNSLIHSNRDLDDVQRLHYLKSSLVGDAAQVVKSLQFSANNYSIAWQAICTRYDQPRMLIRKHLKSILELEPCTKESAGRLRNLSDSLFKHVTALRHLATDEQLFEIIIVHSISSKLDPITSREWETLRNNSSSDLPSLNEFTNFLTNEANLLDSLTTRPRAKVAHEKPKTSSSKSFVTGMPSCMLCKGSHSLSTCEQFLELSPQQRLTKTKELKACINCLRRGHFLSQCSSRFSCRTCRNKHHSLLHIVNSSLDKPGPAVTADTPAEPIENISAFCTNALQVLLPTASAQILDWEGRPHSIRILLDSGSQSNFIRADLCQRLNLRIEDANVIVSGLSKSFSRIRSKCDAMICAHHSDFKLQLSCLLLDQITGTMPSFRVDRNSFKIPDNVRLSDPGFNVPGEIDLLIGSSEFFRLLCVGQIQFGLNLPILQKTRFGWVVSGPINSLVAARSSCHLGTVNDLSDRLSKFWELESYPEDRVYTAEENACEAHFQKSTRRDTDGRFIVSIPLKKPVELLGDSFGIAQKRFLSLEKRLQAYPELSNRYISFMQEYQDMGHMTVSNSDGFEFSNYLPHHGVFKENSITTKLRVVFNASSPTATGQSLNDIQMVGPTIQQDLFSILVRFRKHAYAISADIEKMYRQVLIEPTQRPLQRVLWRSSPKDPLQSFDLNTVTYGTASGSFLAIRCLRQLGIECENSNPEISRIIESDFYVDDLLTGADDLSEARKICSNLAKVLRRGCFILRKWISNDADVLRDFPSSEIHPGILDFGSNEHTNTLGLAWSFQTDSFLFSISQVLPGKVTKRSMLSEISQIFDPLGMLTPCTVGAKILLQQLWLEKISWDDPIPSRILSKWSSYRNELLELNNLRIPRHAIHRSSIDIQIHGFCDSSMLAYGACIYLRSIAQDGQICCNLLCAKSKVTPLKPTTIPKLELCGAALLARLTEQVLKALSLPVSAVHLWTDSTIVLGWLKSNPNRLKTFVCNRVADIQERTSQAVWRHVSTKNNPADMLSRGVSPQALKCSRVWWHGPTWLVDSESSWPETKLIDTSLPEMKGEVQSFITLRDRSFQIINFSDMNRLERTVALCFRFKKNCSEPSERRVTGPLTVAELKSALLCLIKLSQSDSFPEDLKHLKRDLPLKKSSALISFSPFLDTDGIIRVGGRLQNSRFGFDKKHPFLISGKHHLAKLIVTREHIRMLHAGPQMLLLSLRDRFWITSGRTLVKQITHKCLRCFRFTAGTAKPIMGDLPMSRVQPCPPFHTTGVDYGGPFLIKDRKGRGCKTQKAYLCLFICFVTKAIHLELVTSLTSEAFIMTFRRFVSRRGKPKRIYSDNGTNFIGADSALRKLDQFLKTNKDSIVGVLANEGTEWHFIPPHSPHFGGLWEAGVKSAKYHIKRVVGALLMTYEEFCTLLSQVEATLNSRPMFPLSSDPNDLQPLTPSHFLIGKSLTSLPDPDVSELQPSRATSYQMIQQLHQRIWKRWSKEYISVLQQRLKWQSNQAEQLEHGTLVLIKDDNLPPLHWKLGRIIQLHPGRDGIARVASIRTVTGVVRRSYAKICPLPLERD